MYHDGAEYPYLPGLPFYNGQALDTLSNLGFVGECDAKWDRLYQGFEQTLADINERFFTAIDNYNEDGVEAILNYAFELSMTIGVGGLLRDLWNFLASFFTTQASVAAELADAAIKIESTVARWERIVSVGDRQLAESLAIRTNYLNDYRILYNEVLAIRQKMNVLENIARLRETGTGFGYGRNRLNLEVLMTAAQKALYNKLENRSYALTGWTQWRPGVVYGLTSELGTLETELNEINAVIRTLSSVHLPVLREYRDVVLGLVKKINTVTTPLRILWSSNIIRGLLTLIKTFFITIFKLLTIAGWIALSALILYQTYNLLDTLTKICDDYKQKLQKLQDEQSDTIKWYYESVDALINEGCCDIKPCDPPICPNGQKHCPDAEGNCAPCESGSGSGSNTLGVGLQLLLEIDGGSITKYVPVTLVGDGNGSGSGGGGGGSGDGGGGGTTTDHKPVCGFARTRTITKPDGSITIVGNACPPLPDCTTMNLHFYRAPYAYGTNVWSRGGDGGISKAGLSIPNPYTACGYEILKAENDLGGDACATVTDFYKEIKTLILSIGGGIPQLGGGVLDSIDRNNETN